MLRLSPYHAHIYYEADTKQTAMNIVNEMEQLFNLDVGSFHDKPVGPHPTSSIQLTVGPEPFGTILNWLAQNRQGLTVFWHPNTGDVMKDHTDHAIWMGAMPELNLDVLQRFIDKA